ncbi:hypothetical protein HanIR_Chr12g0583101 [Helianthus annuus]|nr:hypothetical protein HanIR_Chr12g0583101 [Helianthus annuus]
MYNYSPIDGFVEISKGLGDMMTSLANEPSVGLFYVQQHAHNAVPNIVNLSNKVVAKSREIGLHTEDTEDSIAMVRSMADCGFPVVDDMIKDIAKCLAIMSSRQPRRGLIRSRSVSWFKTGQTGWRGNVNDFEKSGNANGAANSMQNVGEELPVSSLGGEDAVLVDNMMPNVSGLEDFGGFKDDKEGRIEK